MYKKITLLLLFLLLTNLILVPSAWAQSTTSQSITFDRYALKITDYTLENGLRVILAEDHSAPVVVVNTWFRVGGADDPDQRAGFAHLFEHMMFEGSANVPGGQWDQLLEAIGARNNAYTHNDKTGFWNVAPATELPRLLWMESDRMATLDVTDEAFQTQRQVVIQEYNQRVANRPFGEANLRLFTQPLQGYTPYARPVIGSVADLEAASFEEVEAFHNIYYRPNNATLVIVGDIDVEQTQALVQAYYGEIPAGPPVVQRVERYPYPDTMPVSQTDETTGCQIGTTETLVDNKVEVPRYAVTVAGPLRGTADFYALKLLTDILAGGESSRFQQEIVRQGLAATAFVGFVDYRGASVLYGAALPNQGDDVDAMHDLLIDQFTAVREEGVTAAELARVQQQQLISTISSFRTSVLDTAEWLQDATLTFGDPNSIGEELAMYQAVTLEDIQRVAQTYLCDRPMNMQIVVPEGEQELAADPGEWVAPVAVEPVTTDPATVVTLPDSTIDALPEGVVNRTAVPAPLGDLKTNFPPFKSFALKNGLQVIFVEQHETPTVNLNLFVGGSNTAASQTQQGVADFMADLLTKGTQSRSGEEIAQSIEAVGGSVSSSAGLEWTTLALSAPTTEAPLAFDLLSDLVRNATFPQADFDVVKGQTLTFLQQDAVDPNSMANRQFGRLAYGNHPYGYVMTSETVNKLTRADVVKFYQTYYKPNNALLLIVGDLTAAEVQKLAETALGAWPSGKTPTLMKYPKATVGDTSLIYLIDRPEAQQATVQIGNRAIDARNPDRYALELLNTVLGGGSSSRLYANIREDKGYTYGIYSRFARPNDVGTFRVIGDVNQDHVGDTIQEVMKELKAIQSKPLTEQELADAKGMLLGNFALTLEQPSNFAGQLATRYLTKIPLTEFDQYAAKMQAVTAAQVQAAAKKYIDTKQPIIVVVGNAEVVKPQLEKVGKVLLVDAEGQAVTEAAK